MGNPLADGSLVMARPGVTAPVVDSYEDFAALGHSDTESPDALRRAIEAAA